MFYTPFHSPTVSRWQARLARVPRWAWIAFAIGVIVPVIVLAVAILAIALTTGTIVLLAALLIGAMAAGVSRLLKRPANDGRRNVRIVVSSARVIDP
jgi:uncharacterized membrane protein YdcZ (DUF606 family)